MSEKRRLSTFLLAMMNVAIILSLRGLPLMAKEGLSLIFYLLFSFVIFLIPTALVSAELATGWPQHGGIYRWVTEALGQQFGFSAIFLQWIQNVFWYPTVLSFAAGSLAYLFDSPELAQSNVYNIIVILTLYWGATLVNIKGVKTSSTLSTIGVILGTLLPGAFIIFLGITLSVKGETTLFNNSDHILPDFSSFSNLALLGGIVLLFSGIEVNAVHINDVENPRKTYPRAIALSVLIIFAVFFLGSLSLASVLPKDEISLNAGLMQAFQKILSVCGLLYFTPVVGLLLTFGVIGGITAWIAGPSRGLLSTSKEGLLPPFLSYTNHAGTPTRILIIQGCIVTLLSLVYLIMPSVNSAFFLLTDLNVILYLCMYILLFISALRLRYKYPDVQRTYSVPGGMMGMWLACLIGISGCLFAIFIGFFPPSQLHIVNQTFYIWFLICGLTIALAIPQLLFKSHKEEWKR